MWFRFFVPRRRPDSTLFPYTTLFRSEPSPVFGPSARLDIEAELGFVVGGGTRLGEPVAVADADEHLFGVVLLNDWSARRSEEHTSELQSQSNLVCRLLLEKKKDNDEV